MITNYKYIPTSNKCYVGPEELPLLSTNSFQSIYQHQEAVLVLEKLGSSIITATLKNVVKSLSTIANWEHQDYGRAVWNEQKNDYGLEYGLAKIFRLFNNNYSAAEPWTFYFHYQHHLILKDRDEHKPYYWYYYDYSTELSTFIYETLKGEIKPKHGEIVALPGEAGQTCYDWSAYGDYQVNYSYCGEEEEQANYNFATETAENWQKKNGWTGLVITFLPTSLDNWKLDRGQKLTGVTWFKKIWQVFGKRGIPIVLKCYRGWVYTNLYRYYRGLYDQISSITELPTSIDNREVGSSNLLIYFNMPFLNPKTPYIV